MRRCHGLSSCALDGDGGRGVSIAPQVYLCVDLFQMMTLAVVMGTMTLRTMEMTSKNESTVVLMVEKPFGDGKT